MVNLLGLKPVFMLRSVVCYMLLLSYLLRYHWAFPGTIVTIVTRSCLSHYRRKLQLEAEKQQKGADVKIMSGEVQTLQKEYEAVNSTVLQLEKQKGS